MDGITQDTVPVVRVDGQGLLNGDAGDVAKREIMDEDCVDPPHAHIEQAEEEERKAPEQCEVVMNSIPEQKVRWFLYLRWLVSVLSVRVSVSVFMESVVTLSHSYLTPRSLLSNVLSHLPDLHADVHIRACFLTFCLTGQAFIFSVENIADGLMLSVLFCFLNLVDVDQVDWSLMTKSVIMVHLRTQGHFILLV